MLILHRHPGQAIWIGEKIKVIVLGNTKKNTRIGIEAPKGISIAREELRERGPRYEQK